MVVIEGDCAACDDYIDWLKNRTGNWKALALRGEITEELRGGATLAGKRRLPTEFRELAEDMGTLGQLSAECGLEGEFKSFIMQHRAGGSEPQPDTPDSINTDDKILCSFSTTSLLRLNGHRDCRTSGRSS